MNFLFDENFPRSAVTLIETGGHKVFGVRDFEAQGALDETVFRRAQTLNAVLLTTDKDFFHTVPFLFPSHSGVVVFSLRQPNRKSILERLAWFLSRLPDDMSNRVYMLRDTTYVTARPPEPD